MSTLATAEFTITDQQDLVYRMIWCRSMSTPAAPTGSTYANPGGSWVTTIPAGAENIWVSGGYFDSEGALSGAWEHPALAGVRGETIASAIAGLTPAAHWSLDDVADIPDDVSGRAYLQTAWADVDSWDNHVAGCGTVTAISGTCLRNTWTTDQVYTIQRLRRYWADNMAAATVRVKMRSSVARDVSLQYYDGSAYVVAATVSIGPDWAVYEFYVPIAFRVLRFATHSSYVCVGGETFDMAWCYIGTAAYSTPAIDNSGNLNHMSGIQGVLPVSGASGRGLWFNGVNGALSSAKTMGPKTTDSSFSMACWFSIPSSYVWDTAGRLGIFLVGTYGGSYGIVKGRTDNQILAYIRPTSTTIEVVYNITRDTIYHAVLVYDGSTRTVSLYINGALIGTSGATVSGQDLEDSAAYLGGCRPALTGGTTYHQGMIDEPIFVDRALTAAEASGLYLVKTLPKAYTKADYLLDCAASDSMITPAEKTTVSLRWADITGDGSTTGSYWTSRAAAVALSVAVTVIDAAYTALQAYLFTSPGVIATATWGATITITASTWASLWAAYRKAEADLLTAISLAQSKASSASSQTDANANGWTKLSTVTFDSISTIRKSSGGALWTDANAFTEKTFGAGAKVRGIYSSATGRAIIGLSAAPTNIPTSAAPTYGWYLNAGAMQPRANGSSNTSVGTIVAGKTVLAVLYDGAYIRWLADGLEKYTLWVGPGLTFAAELNVYTVATSFSGVVFSQDGSAVRQPRYLGPFAAMPTTGYGVDDWCLFAGTSDATYTKGQYYYYTGSAWALDSNVDHWGSGLFDLCALAAGAAAGTFSIADLFATRIVALTAFLQILFAKEIAIQPGGHIRAGYLADGTAPASGFGFWLGADGSFKAKEAEFSGKIETNELVIKGITAGTNAIRSMVPSDGSAWNLTTTERQLCSTSIFAEGAVAITTTLSVYTNGLIYPTIYLYVYVDDVLVNTTTYTVAATASGIAISISPISILCGSVIKVKAKSSALLSTAQQVFGIKVCAAQKPGLLSLLGSTTVAAMN